MELRVGMNTNFIYKEYCRHCNNISGSDKYRCSYCRDARPVKVVADFLLDGSGKVLRIS